MIPKWLGAVGLTIAAACQSAALEVLLVDKWLQDPIAFQPFFEDFPGQGMELRYRRFHPTLVQADTADYDVIVVGGGLHPRSAATHLRPAEARLLTGFVRHGGTAVFLFTNGPLSFGNEYVSRNHTDNYILNTVLDSLGLQLRIEGASIQDPTGAKSTIQPWGTWLNLPLLSASPETPLGRGLTRPVPVGRLLTLMVGQHQGLEVPAWTAPTSMRRAASRSTPERGAEALYVGGPRRYAAVVAAPAGAGHVIVASRHAFNMNGYTGRWSDKPISPPYELRDNRRLERNFAAYVAAIARGQHTADSPLPIERLERIDGIPERLRPASAIADRALAARAPDGTYAQLPAIEAGPPHVPRILSPHGRVKSGYVSLPPAARAAEHCEAYRRAGLELLYVKLRLQSSAALVDSTSATFLAACEQSGLRIMLWDYFALGTHGYAGVTSRLVDGAGTAHDKASPFDPAFWEEALRRKALRYAAVAARYPQVVVGMMWDLEVYGHDELLVTESSSFDNLAFAVYLEARGEALRESGRYAEALALLAAERFSWLESQGLLRDYYEVLEEQVFGRARTIRDEVEAIHPELLWGFYTACIPQSWYYRGMFRAFGANELLLITYEARGSQQVDYWRSVLGVRMAHAPGVVFGLPRGDEWTAYLDMCLRHEAGYWLYRPEPLARSAADWRREGLPDTREEVIRRIRQANDAR